MPLLMYQRLRKQAAFCLCRIDLDHHNFLAHLLFIKIDFVERSHSEVASPSTALPVVLATEKVMRRLTQCAFFVHYCWSVFWLFR
jgi:hypothetical protein